MIILIHKIKPWYEQLSLRERFFFALLVLVIAYSFVSLVFYRPLNNTILRYSEEIKKTKDDVQLLNIQIEAVGKISATPLYQEWEKSHLLYEKMQTRFQSLVGSFTPNNWHAVLKTLLADHPNISLAHIENSEEKNFSFANNGDIKAPIYQQDLTLVMYGDYISIIKYLDIVEQNLPAIRWNSFRYEVTNYPTAKITLGLSIFYEKDTKQKS